MTIQDILNKVVLVTGRAIELKDRLCINHPESSDELEEVMELLLEVLKDISKYFYQEEVNAQTDPQTEVTKLRWQVKKLREVLALYVVGDENGALDDAGELGRKVLEET